MPEKNLSLHDPRHARRKRCAATSRIVVLGEDVGARGGVFRATMGFLDEFGEERVLDTPLDEMPDRRRLASGWPSTA